MKRIITILLSVIILLSSCGKAELQSSVISENIVSEEIIDESMKRIEWKEIVPTFESMDDEKLLRYIEDLIYRDAVVALNSEEYFIESVTAVYVSKEYIEELEYNSQPNVYFGYTLAELDEVFQGTRYIFTVDDYGRTIVQELQEIEDISTETILRNIAIGAGVILICVTVSVVSAGMGAPAISMIFAASAATAQSFAVSSATFGGITAGIVRGIQTGDFDEALQAAAMSASEGFKWGAISGAIIGGSTETFLLKKATQSGLSMNDAACIQLDSNLPVDIIGEFHSVDEYIVYKEAGLKSVIVNGRTALIPDIDLEYVSELPDGSRVTNLTRMKMGKAPIDPLSGKEYQLHHIGQENNGTLAVLTERQHLGNASILNIPGKGSQINRNEFAKVRKQFWTSVGDSIVK